jgi:magnesium and cobalt transporter
VIAHLGRLPRRGETLTIAGLRFQVLRADSRRVYTLIVEKPKA